LGYDHDFDISLLDNWRKEAEKSHKLSMIELVKRGMQIENCLRERLNDIEKLPRMDSRSEVTKIFALSALIYLYVVISGPYSELQEIKESVARTVIALENVKLLRNLVWPFCIAGCFALEGKQQSVFRNLISNAEMIPSTLGTCLGAFKIVEECWKQRKLCPCIVD
jgi:hypothetical protein